MCLYLADYLLVFLAFPLVAARFAVYQSSGIVAYFREHKPEGFQAVQERWIGKASRRSEKECLGCVKLYLGAVVEPEDSVNRDIRTDQCSCSHGCVCNQTI